MNESVSNEDLIRTVKDVFVYAIGYNKHYTIPSYQRGYKWNRENVIKLLDDLKHFEQGNTENSQSFYCLQNITIVPLKDDSGWNVVDGQQRLTTLYIILSYLKKEDSSAKSELSFFSVPDCIKYNVRKETGEFLIDEVFTGNIWNDDINPNSAIRKDQWYILDVAAGIKEWFKIPENNIKLETITNRLKLIVNNITDNSVSEEEIFSGLNGGKVDLDGADLVRAELITRSAKEKYQNSDSSKVKEFRMRIALELDTMNLWWSGKEQKTYFEQFLSDSLLKTSSFDHNTYPIGLLYKLYYAIHKRKGEKFGIEFFENGRDFNNKEGDNHWELYETITQLHHTLQMWFNDPLLYHLTGYLMFRFKHETIEENDMKNILPESKGDKVIDINYIWQLWKTSYTKNDYLQKVIMTIKNLLCKRENKDDLVKSIREVNTQWYGKDSQGITDVLVLMDVMICIGIYKDLWEEINPTEIVHVYDLKAGKMRLPAAYFTKHNENFEHIRSCAPNEKEGKEERDKSVWISEISRNYNVNDVNSEPQKETDEQKMRNALLDILNQYPNDTLDDAIIQRLNIKMNEYGQHSIGNMALLIEHVNKSYGNAPFQEKIQRIFMEYMNNKWYIRPYTMIVFERKLNDKDKLWRWTRLNIGENATNIANNINRFLNIEL